MSLRLPHLSRAVLIACVVGMAGCGKETPTTEKITGGDPQNGKTLILQYGCAGCHVVGGIAGAAAQVGPSLTHIRERGYIAGVLDNTPANLQRWIMNPTEINPKTAMPDLGVTEEQARDIAAYLYTQ